MDWSKLKHAYGVATDIPDLLAELSPDRDSEVWEKLWSCLCHQYSVYSASFAALPALLNAAESWRSDDRDGPIALAAAILASEDVQGVRDDFLRPVEYVVPRFLQLCKERLETPGLEKSHFIYLLRAAAAFAGDRKEANQMDRLADGSFRALCPHCNVTMDIVLGSLGFFATTEDWALFASDRFRVTVRPGIQKSSVQKSTKPLPKAGQRLCDYAIDAQQDEIVTLIKHLFGTSVCPSCGHAFEVQDAIAKWYG